MPIMRYLSFDISTFVLSVVVNTLFIELNIL